MFDLISIGDANIDTYISLNQSDVDLVNNGKSLKICFPLGEKIPTGPSFSTVAGNAVNLSLAAKKLGLKTAIYTNVGNDLDGEKINNKLKSEGVNNIYVVKDKELLSNHNIVLTLNGERVIFVSHEPWKYNLPDLDRAKWIYLTSLASNFLETPIIAQLINYLERSGAKLFYNPGTFQIKAGFKKIPRLLSLIEVLIVNLEEAKIVLGYQEEENIPIKKLLKKIVDLGPKMVVITNNKEGSYSFDGENFYHLENFSAKLVDMTGAGDSYSAGLLAGLYYNKELKEAMRWGGANAASNIEVIGATDGLLSYENILKKLKENPKIQAKII